eukprot:COSAG02_NODE_559_length_20335_cov_10.631894_7_plen_47_part_00
MQPPGTKVESFGASDIALHAMHMSIFVDLVALSWCPFLAEKRSENG